MRWLLLMALLLAGSLGGQEAPATRVKERLRDRIRETLPAPPPTGTMAGRPEPGGPVLVLEPLVVTESRALRELDRQLVDEKRKQEAEAFSVVKGGKIYRSDRLDFGLWWAPESGGWDLLKLKW